MCSEKLKVLPNISIIVNSIHFDVISVITRVVTNCGLNHAVIQAIISEIAVYGTTHEWTSDIAEEMLHLKTRLQPIRG